MSGRRDAHRTFHDHRFLSRNGQPNVRFTSIVTVGEAFPGGTAAK